MKKDFVMNHLATMANRVAEADVTRRNNDFAQASELLDQLADILGRHHDDLTLRSFEGRLRSLHASVKMRTELSKVAAG